MPTGGKGAVGRDAHVGRRIRGKRRAMGLEQAALARVLRVTVDTIEGYETGAAPVPSEHLRQLATYFSVSLDYFLPAT